MVLFVLFFRPGGEHGHSAGPGPQTDLHQNRGLQRPDDAASVDSVP